MNEYTKPTLKEPTKLTKWKKEPKLSQLKQDYADAKIETDKHVSDVDRWLDNLHIKGSARIAKSKTRSSIQPKLIRKQAEWRYSSLSEPFLSTADVFNVSPVTFEDKKAAEQNQLILNHQFNNKLDKVHFIDEYVRTAVDEGTVIVRTGWDYEEEVIEKELPVYSQRVNPDPAYAQQLAQAGQMYQQNPEEFAQQATEELKMSLQASMETQQPIEVFQSGTEIVEETVVTRNQPTAEVCDYRDVVLDPTCKGVLKKAKFGIYRFTTSLEELEAAGFYKNLDEIVTNTNSILGEPDYDTPDNDTFNFKDEPRKKFMAYEYWGFCDYEENGKLQGFVATWVGNTLIRLDSNPFPDQELPFVAISTLPVRKSLYGEPDGELIKDNQDVVGAVTRGMIDIMASNASGQKGRRKDALDITNQRRYDKGDDYEFNVHVDPRQAFYTHVPAEIPNSSQFMYQIQNMEAEALTGVKAFSDGINGTSFGDTATGVNGVLAASSKRESGILRRLADGIVQVANKFISMNSEFLADEEIVRITNDEFIAIDREALAGHFDLKLSISTAEEDNQKAQELAFMLQTTGPSSDPGEVRMIRAEIARLRRMPDLAKKIEDYEPQPDPIEQMKGQLEIELLKAQIAEVQAEAAQRQATAQLNMSKSAEVDSQTDLNNLDFVEQESGVKQERNLQKQGEQAKANAKLEMVKSALASDNPTK
jgi:hypothetical protein